MSKEKLEKILWEVMECPSHSREAGCLVNERAERVVEQVMKRIEEENLFGKES